MAALKLITLGDRPLLISTEHLIEQWRHALPRPSQAEMAALRLITLGDRPLLRITHTAPCSCH
eukprot:9997705-Karenia_brevis.AAC.1